METVRYELDAQTVIDFNEFHVRGTSGHRVESLSIAAMEDRWKEETFSQATGIVGFIVRPTSDGTCLLINI